MFFVDSHCHLDLLDCKRDRQKINNVIKKAFSNKVHYMLSVSTSLNNFLDLKIKINQHKNVFLSCGIHPCEVQENDSVVKLVELASDDLVVALGETGLDYFYSTKTAELQKKSFRRHIQIGRILNKPIIIHSRKAQKDVLSILKEESIGECGGVLHCFAETKEVAKMFLDLGLYISFSGIVTFKNSEYIRESAKYVPLDRMLIETDSPYLTPNPYRGIENEPFYLIHIANYLAKLKKIEIEKIAEVTSNNFFNLFRLVPKKI